MKKQTAVEWLAIKFSQSSEDELAENINLWFGQAKAMEEEQIVNAYATAVMKENNSDYIGMHEETSASIYYTSTYGK
jgi:hypothetical protein